MAVDVKKILQRYETAKTRRQNWDTHWQEIADLVAPTRDFTVLREPGRQRRVQIFDATAANAHRDLALFVHGLLVNPATRWFALHAIDDELDEDRDVRLWLEDVTSRMLAHFANPITEFSTNSFEILLDHTSFGTGVLLIRDDPDTIRFQARPLQNMWLEADSRGKIIAEYSLVPMAAHEVVARWPLTASANTIRLAEDVKQSQKIIDVLHCVMERDDRDPQRQDGPNKPFASIYIEIQARSMLSQGGFNQDPYVISRWTKAPGEIYGRSPSMEALPDIKTINSMRKTGLIVGELAAYPPINVPANSIEGDIRTAPGSINYFKSGTREMPTAMITGANPDSVTRDVHEVRQQIENAFFMDVFKLPGQSSSVQGGHPRMTATEILERRRDQLQLFSPILARLYGEFLRPVVTRTYQSMRKRGMFLPPPEQLAGAGMNIDFVSPLALSQKASETTGFTQLMQVASPVIAADPGVLQNLDADQTFRWLAGLFGVTPRILRPEEDVAQLRADEAAQQAAIQQAELAKTSAGAARDAAAGLKDAISAA